MATFRMGDGTEIFYKDWGPRTAQPIVFHHGWPLSADDWDNQMMFFHAHGYRVIAHDRRGHGRSTQVDVDSDMDTYAADMASLADALDLGKISVGPPYFGTLFLVLMAPLVLLLPFGPLTRWQREDMSKPVAMLLPWLALALLGGAIAFFVAPQGPWKCESQLSPRRTGRKADAKR